VLAVLVLVALPTGGSAQQVDSSRQAADAKTAASIKEAVADGKLTKIEGGDYKIDHPVRLSPTPAMDAKAGEMEVLYQLGVSPKDNSAIFLPVRTQPAESADAAKRIDQALLEVNLSSSAQIQMCVGERTCAKVCGTGAGEYCCKWKCERPSSK
jgi:hypothetical protein